MEEIWNEVKALAGDFQRAQLSSTVQRLSERNCIEIVSKLIELNLLHVYFTNDGKEYVTQQHVERELLDELYVNGGRANLVDFVTALNLDFSIIEAKTKELVQKNSNKYSLVLGELIERDYLKKIATEINEKLQLHGQLFLGELAGEYGLPSEFMDKFIEKELGKTIKGQSDPNNHDSIFTDAFIARQRGKVRGALIAMTRPTQLLNMLNRLGLQQNTVQTVYEELSKANQVAGSLSGGGRQNTFTPTIYSKSQNDWVDSFCKQNGYVEFDNLVRLGIHDPQGYLKKHFKDDSKMIFLNSCIISQNLLDQVEAVFDEAIQCDSWIDIQASMPSICSDSDGERLLQMIMKSPARAKTASTAHVFCGTMVVSEKLMQDLIKVFDPLMAAKAEVDSSRGVEYFSAQVGKVDSGEAVEKKEKKDKRKKKAPAKGGGGAGSQGREVKTKAVKKKYRAHGVSDESGSDDDSASAARPNKRDELTFLTVEEIESHVEKFDALKDAPAELVSEIAQHLFRPLTKSYQQVVMSVFMSSTTKAGTSRKKLHADLQEKINGLVHNFRLFEKGLKVFSSDTQTQLVKHLLKTIGTDMVNMLFNYLAREHLMTNDENTDLTHEVRGKLTTKFPPEAKEPLTKLNSSLNGKSTEDFLSCLEDALAPGICDIILRKADKKKERQTLFAHRQTLIEQLSSAQEPALALHLAVLVLFQLTTHSMLHASGKFVPQIVAQLQGNIPADVFSALQHCQGLVIKKLTLDANDEQLAAVNGELESLLPKVKEAVTTFRKTSQSEDA